MANPICQICREARSPGGSPDDPEHVALEHRVCHACFPQLLGIPRRCPICRHVYRNPAAQAGAAPLPRELVLDLVEGGEEEEDIERNRELLLVLDGINDILVLLQNNEGRGGAELLRRARFVGHWVHNLNTAWVSHGLDEEGEALAPLAIGMGREVVEIARTAVRGAAVMDLVRDLRRRFDDTFA